MGLEEEKLARELKILRAKRKTFETKLAKSAGKRKLKRLISEEKAKIRKLKIQPAVRVGKKTLKGAKKTRKFIKKSFKGSKSGFKGTVGTGGRGIF